MATTRLLAEIEADPEWARTALVGNPVPQELHRVRVLAVVDPDAAASTDAQKVALIAAIMETCDRNNEDDEGDRQLSSHGYAMDAIDTVLREGDLARLVRSGWFPAEMI
jgi:hypothetical protein